MRDFNLTYVSISLASVLLLAVRAEPIASTLDQHVFDSSSSSSSTPAHAHAHEPLSAFDGHGHGRLWRFDVEESTEALEDAMDLINTHDLDLWNAAKSYLDVYVPNDAPGLPAALRRLQHTLLANISSAEARSRPRPRLAHTHTRKWDLSSLRNTTFHGDYHPLAEIDEFMREMARMNPGRVEVRRVGSSAMGREMVSLVVSSSGEGGGGARYGRREKKFSSSKGKLSFVIIGAQHAREWIATATSLYLAHALVSDPSEPHSLSSLLNVFDFYIIPVPNPDGYDYTWENDRFWYKTRQQLGANRDCLGIDMNRNWGYKWKKAQKRRRSGADPCSHWYPGNRPFEAPEVNSIANMVAAIPNLVGFIDLRSYGQMLSSPFSYSCSAVPKDAEDQIEAGLGAAWEMAQVHGTTMTTGSLCANLYRAPGNVLDWMYKRVKVKYSYALHLRDTGTYGFTLPPDWIRPVGEETSAMVEYLAKFIAAKMKRGL